MPLTASIVLPTLNEASRIGILLDSIVRQTGDVLERTEVIIVDGGSTDGTPAKALEYIGEGKALKGHVTIYENSSIGAARQKGTEEATGDIIISTDADCTFDPNVVQRVLYHFEKYPKLVLLSGRLLSADGSILRNFAGMFASAWLMGMGCTSSFRKSAFMQTSGYPDSNGGEDMDLSYQLQELGCVHYDPDILIFMDLTPKWLATIGGLISIGGLFVRPFHKQIGSAMTGAGLMISVAEIGAYNGLFWKPFDIHVHHDVESIALFPIGAVAYTAHEEAGSLIVGMGVGGLLHHLLTEFACPRNEVCLLPIGGT